VTVRTPDGREQELTWDRLVLAPGSVTRTFDIPGLTEHAHGLKNLTEAVYLRDHVRSVSASRPTSSECSRG